jgi:YHS domain-containing protein
MLKDPVCGKRINRNKAHVVIEHEGVKYFLCCPLCQTQFERAPTAYAKPELGELVKKNSRQTYGRQLP